MLRFKDKSTGKTKYVLRDTDEQGPVEVDTLVLQDDKNNSEEDPDEQPTKEKQDATVRTTK